MMPSSRKKLPQTEGPGRGSPRSRTVARPNVRAGRPLDASAKSALVGATAQADGVDDSVLAAPLRRGMRAFGTVIAIVVLFAVFYGTNVVRLFQQRAAIAETTAEIQRLEDSISQLEDELRRWQDPNYVQIQARERLGWVVPGEIGFIVLGPDGQPLGSGTPIQRIGTLPEGEHSEMWFERLWMSVGTADDPEPAPTRPEVTPDEPPR